MGIGDLLKAKRDAILRIAEQCGIQNVRIFGSVARQETTPASDVDLLVSVQKGRNLLDLIAFAQDVEELLGCKVDVVAEGGISPYLADRIYAEARPL
jgi:predicted nucleotidyltransferase